MPTIDTHHLEHSINRCVREALDDRDFRTALRNDRLIDEVRRIRDRQEWILYGLWIAGCAAVVIALMLSTVLERNIAAEIKRIAGYHPPATPTPVSRPASGAEAHSAHSPS